MGRGDRLNRVYLDTNVFIYAIGGESPHRDPARVLLRAVAEGRLAGETSAYTVQEIVRQRRRRGDAEATTRGREAAALCAVLHPVDRDVAVTALDLVDRHPGLDVADAVHVSTAMTHGLSVLVSADRDLDGIPWIERVDPRDGDRLAALTSE